MKHTPRLSLLAFLAGAVACAPQVVPGQAAITYWTGASNNSWAIAGNWSRGLPGNDFNSDALFEAGGLNQAIVLTNSYTIRTLFFTGGNYSISKTASETFNLSEIAQYGSGTVTINASRLATNRQFVVTGTGSGDVTVNGDINTGNYGAYPIVFKISPSRLTFNGVLTTTNGGTNEFRAGITEFHGTMNAAGGLIQVGGRSAYQKDRYIDVSGAALVLVDTNVATANRLGGLRQVNLGNQALLEYRGNASADSLEQTSGALSINNPSGGGSPGAMIRMVSQSGQKAWMTFGALSNQNGTWNGDKNTHPTLLSFLVPSGDTLGASGSTGGRVTFLTSPPLNNGLLRYTVVKSASDVTFGSYDASVDSGLELGVTPYYAYDSTNFNQALPDTANFDISGAWTATGAKALNAIRITSTGPGQSLTLSNTTFRVKNASGLIFQGSDAYSITGGAGSTNVFGTGAGSAGYMYVDSATLTISTGTFVQEGDLAKAGDGMLVVDSPTYRFNSARSLSAARGSVDQDDVRISGAFASFGGGLAGFGGAGRIALTGSGDSSGFTNGFSLQGATLILAKDSAALNSTALGSGTFQFFAGTLMARGNSANITNAVSLNNIGSGQHAIRVAGDQPITISGTMTHQNNQTCFLQNDSTATLTLAGNIQGQSTGTSGNQINIAGSGKTVVSGNVVAGAGTGANPLTKTGTGLLVLSGSNALSGTVFIQGGQLRVESLFALGTGNVRFTEAPELRPKGAILELAGAYTNFTNPLGTGPGQVRFGATGNGGSGGFAAADAAGAVVDIGPGALLQWGAVNFMEFGGITSELQFGSTNAQGTVVFKNTFGLGSSGQKTIRVFDGPAAVEARLTGTITNFGGFVKEGAGTLELTGANTYGPNPTTVTNGTLLVNNTSGSGTGTGPVFVMSNATLGGFGYIRGAVTNSGMVSPSTTNVVGILTVSNQFTFESGSTYAWDYGVGTVDVISAGSARFPGAWTLNANAAGITNGSYTILTTTGGVLVFTTPTLVGVTGTVAVVGNDVVLTVGSPAPSLTPFQVWQTNYFGPSGTNSAAGAYDADPDNDGSANLQEYAFGSNPTSGASVSAPAVGSSGDFLTITVPRNSNATDVSYLVQRSTDLLVWATNTVLTATNPAPAGSTVTHTNSAPISANPQQFLRVKISLP